MQNELYKEDRDAGNEYRKKQFKQLNRLIEIKRQKADSKRADFFKPDFSSSESYKKSIAGYREKFINMLGWPLNEYSKCSPLPSAKSIYVSEDAYGKIYRLNIEIIDGFEAYGLLFIPKGEGDFPLIIAQHGGLGTPELCSGFFGSANYNDMTRRVLKKGFAVFAPQLLLWGKEFGPDYDRKHIDTQFKQLGGSIAALEIYMIMRSLDYLIEKLEISDNKIGMIGLSYGGFYTLFTTACDVRIKAALSSCFFNNRFVYDWSDWTWLNSANTFLDAEVCGMICPRPLYIEVGKNDEVFDVSYVEKEFETLRKYYKNLGVENGLVLEKFEGAHELDVKDDGIDFLCRKVMQSK